MELVKKNQSRGCNVMWRQCDTRMSAISTISSSDGGKDKGERSMALSERVPNVQCLLNEIKARR